MREKSSIDCEEKPPDSTMQRMRVEFGAGDVVEVIVALRAGDTIIVSLNDTPGVKVTRNARKLKIEQADTGQGA